MSVEGVGQNPVEKPDQVDVGSDGEKPDLSVNTSSFSHALRESFESADCFMNILSGRESFSGDEDLMFVAQRFGDFARAMELNKAEFFENEAAIRLFRLKLKKFMNQVGEEIRRLEVAVNAHGGYANFTDGWQSRMKKACYYAFFVHYGAVRRDEYDKKGQQRDYVSHVVRSAFNGLGRKLMFFDERTFLATIFHDTKEDYKRGILQVLGCDFEKDGKKDKALDFLDTIYSDVENGIDYDTSEDLSLAEIVDLVSKEEGDDRIMALMKMFRKVAGQNNSQKKFSALMSVVMIKLADRLDNLSSPFAGPVRDESILVYATILRCFGAVNPLEWVHDYFAKGQEGRKEISRIRSVSDISAPNETMIQDFVIDFERQLNEEMSAGEEFRKDRDYVFVFRGVGARFEAELDKVEEWRYSDYYAKALRRMIICYPTGSDEARNECFRRKASEVLHQIFNHNLSEEMWKDESHADEPEYYDFLRSQLSFIGSVLETPLGETLLKRAEYGMSNNPNNFSDKYGVGLYGVWPSMREAMKELLGKLPVARFYEDGEAVTYKENAVDIFSMIGEQIDYYIQCYERFLKSEDGTDTGKRTQILKVLSYAIGSMFMDNKKVVVFSLDTQSPIFRDLLRDAEEFVNEFLEAI